MLALGIVFTIIGSIGFGIGIAIRVSDLSQLVHAAGGVGISDILIYVFGPMLALGIFFIIFGSIRKKKRAAAMQGQPVQNPNFYGQPQYAPQQPQQPAQQPAQAVCPNCGAPIPNGSAFCTQCGTKIG